MEQPTLFEEPKKAAGLAAPVERLVSEPLLLNGDCHQLLPTLPDKSVSLIVTDPPYNEVNRDSNGLRGLDKGVADSASIDIDFLVPEFSRICTGSIYVWCGIEQVSLWRKAFVKARWSTRQCAWKKTNPSPMNAQYIWTSGLELCVFAKRPKATFNRFFETPLWEGPTRPKESDHPTNKPIWLMEELIDASSEIGDTVLDPFMGGGSTGIACKNLGRKFIGIELDKKYYELATKRIQAH